MEQIYTIPVNEAFDTALERPECGCPVCMLYRKLEENELDIILGASMMEPDIRIKTNEEGFCLGHFKKMHGRRRMLGLGLILESHLEEVEKLLDGPTFLGNKRAAAVSALGELESTCYVCGRINKNLSMMIATIVYLWESNLDFRRKLGKIDRFCLPHYRAILEYASKKMPKRVYAEFYDAIYAVEKRYITSLRSDVSWFCKKFDYRYDEEPWYNSNDSVKRAIAFLGTEPEEDIKDTRRNGGTAE